MDWCPTPPNIAFRFNADAWYNLYMFLLDIEGALRAMRKYALTVVGTADVKKRASWIGEVDIGIMKKIFAAPKEGKGEGMEVKLNEGCVKVLATKLLELFGGDKRSFAQRLGLFGIPQENGAMESCHTLVVRDDFVPARLKAETRNGNPRLRRPWCPP